MSINKLNPKKFLGATLKETPVKSTKVDEIIDVVNGLTEGTQVVEDLTVTDDAAVGGDLAVTGTATATGGLKTATANATLITKLVTLTATEIVGTAAGDIGHAGGAILVAAESGVINQFVCATLVYDFATAAYTGGDDDLVIRQGTTAVSAAIAKADLLADTADDIAFVNALSAADIKLTANSTINLAGTAYTQPGTAAGVLRCYVTYLRIVSGL